MHPLSSWREFICRRREGRQSLQHCRTAILQSPAAVDAGNALGNGSRTIGQTSVRSPPLLPSRPRVAGRLRDVTNGPGVTAACQQVTARERTATLQRSDLDTIAGICRSPKPLCRASRQKSSRSPSRGLCGCADSVTVHPANTHPGNAESFSWPCGRVNGLSVSRADTKRGHGHPLQSALLASTSIWREYIHTVPAHHK